MPPHNKAEEGEQDDDADQVVEHAPAQQEGLQRVGAEDLRML